MSNTTANRDAVWITGVGAATPLGNTYETVADNLLAGKSGVRAVTWFDVSKHLCKIAAPIQPVPVPSPWSEEEFRRLDPSEQVHLWCATQALQDAGWWERRQEIRLGLVLGIGAEWLRTWEIDYCRGGKKVRNPSDDHHSIQDKLRTWLELTGPMATVGAACASANYALAQARRWLALDLVEVCLAGSCTVDATRMSLASFGNLGALSKRNQEPTAASRPFDKERDGFVMGEGGALFVLEPADPARRRGARPYAELAGFGASSDASHMVIPSTDPKPAAQAMRIALENATVNPDEIDYINAHATSTPLGDSAECRALHLVLGDAVRRVPVSSTKSMTGHLLSGAAAVEALFCLIAMEREAIPPTINLDHPDPECDLCHVPHQARPQPVRVAVSNSFGFGGSNTCIVLRKVA
jgi:3-oxoacyl-[acyl-carrier-protein] synthase II